jgi:glycosyltransferase involved in cell wall biosynthesis
MNLPESVHEKPSLPPMFYIVHEYPPIIGGAGIYVSTIADEIRRDQPLTVITASDTIRTKHESKENLEVVKLGIPFRNRTFHYATAKSLIVFAIRALIKGWKLGRKRPPRGIHAFHVFPAGLAAVILGRILKVPVYITAVGAEIHDPAKKTGLYTSWYYKKFIAAIMRRAVKLSAISQDIAGRASEYYGEKEISVLPPGIPEPRNIPEPVPHDAFILCSVSRLAKRKGIPLTIEAIAELKDLPVRYVLVGDGSDRESLVELARSKGILDRLDFRGFVDEQEKYRILSQSDVFVLPSLHEGFGICYVEAMAAGLPVIANSVGGQVDFITHGENGFLLKKMRKEELAEAIATLYRNPNVRELMSIENRKRARQYYTSTLKSLYLDHYLR